MPPTTIVKLAPEIKAQIHPEMNAGLDVDSLAAKSSQKIWWVCQEHGHPYTSTPRHKTDGAGCSVCSGKQILAGFNDLATTRPDIAAQWHPTLNGDLTPTMVSKNYSKKVWWQCNLGHEFQSLAGNRRSVNTCSVCSGYEIVAGFNDAATLFPHLVDKFHPTKNDVLLDSIGKSYPKKLWWVPECGHEVESLIANCWEKIPCAICNGKQVLTGFNDLATTHPEIAALWHPTKNLPATPQAITKGSKTKRWWICENGHEDFALPNNVIVKNGRCSYCAGNKLTIGVNDFQTLYPEAAKEWHPTLNEGVLPSMIASGSHKKYWWKCTVCEESWDAPPANRGSKKIGCPVCAGQKIVKGINDLATVFPTVAAMWHPTLNSDLKPTRVTAGSPQLAWWKCSADHEWQTRVIEMRKSFQKGQIGCGICYRNSLTSGSKSLAEMWPDIATDWDHAKNSTTPDRIAQFSNKEVWWKCSVNQNHSWKATVANRTRHGSNCATCWKEGSGSQAEEDLALFLESLGLVIERKVITMLENRKELDIYIPAYNVAVEYNGLHWHSEKYRSSEYHSNKYQECKEKGITLVQIWEDDWLDRKEIVQNWLASYFGKEKLLTKISKEWCIDYSEDNLTCKEIDATPANDFLNAVHLKGATTGSHYFGLLDDSHTLIAMLAMDVTGVDGEYAITRYAAKGIIPDGFSILLKSAMETINPVRLVFVSDNAMPEHKMFSKYGFKLDRTHSADYMYTKDKKRIDKTHFHHVKVQKNPNMLYFEGLDENKLAQKNGFIRIWDAGKTQWILEIASI